MHNRRRNSYIETSYTGVGAFSSAPAPHTNALAAASVIGNALKANNHDPSNLNLPKVQAPKSARPLPRSTSITSNVNNSKRNIVGSPSIPQSSPTLRSNSVNTANARRLSLSSIPKQRLASQKSTPNLKSRRSVSDFTNPSSSSSSPLKPVVHLPQRNIPRMIKKYVPSANGLMAVEVPNPKHPDNLKPPSPSRIQSFRRSTSLANMPTRIQQKQPYQQQKNITDTSSSHQHSIERHTSRSISKNIKRETKLLPDGTRVISTTVEEYIEGPFTDNMYNSPSDDPYADFDDDHRQVDMSVTLDEVHSNIQEENDDEKDLENEKEPIISNKNILEEVNEPANNIIHEATKNSEESEAERLIDELASEIKYENEVKKSIEHNEKLEQFERENAFKSINEPVHDPVVIEDVMTRKFTQSLAPHLNSDVQSSRITRPGLGKINAINEELMQDNLDESYNDFYEEEYQRVNTKKEVQLSDGDADNASYIDDIDEGDYVDDIDEDVQQVSNTLQEHGKEEYLAAQQKLNQLTKQHEPQVFKSDEITEKDNGLTSVITNQTEIDDLSYKADLNKESYSVQESPLKSTQTPFIDKVVTNGSESKLLSKKTSSVYSALEDIKVAPSATGDDFYTPPVTPMVETLADKAFTDKGQFNANNPTEISGENKPATGETPIMRFEFSSSGTAFRKSESPESSIIHNSDISLTTAPTNTIRTNKSMAQHLRPTISIPPSPVKSSLLNPNNTNDANVVKSKASENIGLQERKVDELVDLKVPKREPSVQAQIDYVEKYKTKDLSNGNNDLPDIEDMNKSSDIHQISALNSSSSSLVRRKSALKSSSNSRSSLYVSNGEQANPSEAYLSLKTAQNTKLNAFSPLNPPPGPVSSKRLSINALQDSNVNQLSTRSRSGSATSSGMHNSDLAPLTAATKAAQRHSIQPGTLACSKYEHQDARYKKRNSVQNSKDYALRDVNMDTLSANVGGIKALNPKVEEAKKRILQNRPAKNRAKELYELAKTRSPVKPNDLIGLDDKFVRKSSFEKTIEPKSEINQLENNNSVSKSKMLALSLRQGDGLDYEQYDRRKYMNPTFKSRFAGNDSDTDIPLPPLQPLQTSASGPTSSYPEESISTDAIHNEPLNRSIHPEKLRSGFKFKLSGLNRKKSKPGLDISSHMDNPHLQPETVHHPNQDTTHKESKFEKFFSETHGPGKRNVSSASAMTAVSAATDEGKKKKGFFKKMLRN